MYYFIHCSCKFQPIEIDTFCVSKNGQIMKKTNLHDTCDNTAAKTTGSHHMHLTLRKIAVDVEFFDRN